MRRIALVLLLAGCAPEAGPPAPIEVPGAAHLRLEADPGAPPHEAPRVHTLWAREGGAWQRAGRVLDVAPGGQIVVDAGQRLVVGGREVDREVLPPLVADGEGGVYYVRRTGPFATDVWHLPAGGVPAPVTTDGRSDRPFPVPGGLLWVSSAPDGVAGWVRDGRKITRGLEVPVPAFPAKTRLAGDRVVYDAGDGEWALDPTSGEARRR